MALKICAGYVLSSIGLRRNVSLVMNRSLLNTMAGDQINNIKFEILKDKVMKRDVVLIDVREPKELKEDGKIPNSLNIPLGEIAEAFQLSDSDFQAKYQTPKPKLDSSDIVLSCRSGKRANNAFAILHSLGYKKASVYSGSFQDWVKNGGLVEK